MTQPSRPARSALVLPVPAADPALAEIARRYPGTVRDGTPAHLTVLYPFVPPAALSDDVVADCARIAEATAPFSVRFTRCLTRPGMVYLPPEPSAPVTDLIAAVRARWPHVLPYGGRYPDSPPHVTLALDPGPAAEGVVALLRPLLPLSAALDELLLVVADDAGWQVRARLPLTG